MSANDAGDRDAGGNDLQNFPVIEQAMVSGNTFTISGVAAPNALIELFIAAPDDSGFGEGQTYLLPLNEGSSSDTDTSPGSDTTNRFRFTMPTPSGVTTGTKLTATATALDGSTSEFSGVTTVAAAPTAITLTSFTAMAEHDTIVVRWETATELNTAGFRIWRSTTGKRDDAKPITAELIVAKGDGARGATYRWDDPAVVPNVSYTYWLQEVETGGVATMHGPTKAHIGLWQTLLPLMR